MKKSAYFLIFEFILFSVILIIFASALNILFRDKSELPAAAKPVIPRYTIVIDPGHGGIDGGAVGVNGCKEKDLNLSVSLLLKDRFEKSGYKVVMTRTEDVLLSEDARAGKRKISDLNKRIEITNGCSDPVYIGIHMNTNSVSSCRGLSVYYSANNGISKTLAQSITDANIRYLQPGNKRTAKDAGSSIHILENLSCPAVLIECGFISNPDEAELLCDTEYQKKTAEVIFEGVSKMIEGG